MFLLTGLRLLNLSERNAFHLGTVQGFAALQIAADILGLFRIADYCGRTGLGVAKTATDQAALGYAYLGIRVHQYLLGRFTMTLDSGHRSAEAFRTSGYWNLHGWAIAALFGRLGSLLFGQFC